MKYIIILIALLSSCSAEWHLKRAVKKNPKYGDSTKVYIPYIKDTTIYVQLPGDTNETSLKFRDWYNRAKDSTATLYKDSMLHIYQKLDSLGNVKTKIIRTPYILEVPITIHDTIPVNCPPTISVEDNKWSTFDWILLFVSIVLFLLLIIQYKLK
jgi:hypothetical protein